jgi:DNA-binding transcriptional ArsR family regulator
MTDETDRRLDRVFAVMADADRRRLLYYLREHGSATRTELADVLAGWLATDRQDGAVTADRRRRIESALYHQHLPRLSRSGLVDDRDDGTVVAADWPPWVAQYLDLAFEVEIARTDDLGEVARRLAGERDLD